MNNYAAEFISPKVSKHHQIDPTIGCISFNPNPKQMGNENIIQKLFQPNLLSQISKLSLGEEIEIEDDDIQYLILISILLENDELFAKLTELLVMASPDNDKVIDLFLNQLQLSDLLEEKFNTSKFDYMKLTDKIASEFYAMDWTKLNHLSPSTLLQIISSDKLKLWNEDSLFDFINSYHEQTGIPIIEFYQQLELVELSEDKFGEFLQLFDFNSITSPLWSKLQNCFYFNYQQNQFNQNRYYSLPFGFDTLFSDD